MKYYIKRKFKYTCCRVQVLDLGEHFEIVVVFITNG